MLVLHQIPRKDLMSSGGRKKQEVFRMRIEMLLNEFCVKMWGKGKKNLQQCELRVFTIQSQLVEFENDK